MDRRHRLEDKNAELEQQTYNLFPDRWADLYKDKLLAELGLPNGEGEIPLQEDDLAALDKFMDQLVRGQAFPGAAVWGMACAAARIQRIAPGLPPRAEVDAIAAAILPQPL